MSNYWPTGIELNDNDSPQKILEVAKDDWLAQSSGILTLLFQNLKTDSGIPSIVVHAKHNPTNRTAALFSVFHRPDAPYPATILPKDDDMPRFLKKTYYEKGFNPSINISGRYVTNDWVSDTPAEFRTKLEEVFNLGIVKSEIISLLSGVSLPDTGPDIEPKNEDPLSD